MGSKMRIFARNSHRFGPKICIWPPQPGCAPHIHRVSTGGGNRGGGCCHERLNHMSAAICSKKDRAHTVAPCSGTCYGTQNAYFRKDFTSLRIENDHFSSFLHFSACQIRLCAFFWGEGCLCLSICLSVCICVRLESPHWRIASPTNPSSAKADDPKIFLFDPTVLVCACCASGPIWACV